MADGSKTKIVPQQGRKRAVERVKVSTLLRGPVLKRVRAKATREQRPVSTVIALLVERGLEREAAAEA